MKRGVLFIGIIVICWASLPMPGHAQNGEPTTGVLESSNSVAAALFTGRIAFTTQIATAPTSYRLALSTMRADGSNVFEVRSGTDNQRYNDRRWASLSSDGRRLTYSGQGQTIYPALWIVNADGNGAIRISDPGATGGGLLTHVSVEEAAWSSDDRNLAVVLLRSDGVEMLSLIPPDGSSFALIGLLTTQFYRINRPDWHPSGNTLAFAAYSGSPGSGFGQLMGIYSSNLNGGAVTLLIAGGNNPSWSPDGTKLAYDIGCDIYVKNMVTQAITRLTTRPNTNQCNENPDWSPDGTAIAFVSNRDGNKEIYAMNADGTSQTRLTTTPGDDDDPVWSHDPNLKEWTLMFYFVADADSDRSTVLDTIVEGMINRLKTSLTTNNAPFVTVVAMIDWAAKGRSSQYLSFSPGNVATLRNLGETNMGDPSTLSNFVEWANRNWPARHTALVIFGHGQGVTGVAQDFYIGSPLDGVAYDYLNMAELRTSLIGRHFDVVHMFACIMGLIEPAYQLRGITDYFVASQAFATTSTELPGAYASLLGLNVSADTFARGIVDEYWRVHSSNRRPTMSALNMSQLEYLVNRTNALSRILLNSIEGQGQNSVGYKAMNYAKLRVQRFDMNNDEKIDTKDEFVDLNHFAELIGAYASPPNSNVPELKTAADEVLQAVNQAVVSRKPATPEDFVIPVKYNNDWDHSESHGISIFLPEKKRRFYVEQWLDFARGTSSWPNFFMSRLTAAPDAFYPLAEDAPIYWAPLLNRWTQMGYVYKGIPIEEDPNPPELQPFLYEEIKYQTYVPALSR